MLVCGAGDRRRGEGGAIAAASAAEKRSSLTSMLLKKKRCLMGMTHLFTCYSYVGMSAFMLLTQKVDVFTFNSLARIKKQQKKKKKRIYSKERDSSDSVRFELSYQWAPGILFDFLLIQQGCHFLQRVAWRELPLGVRGQFNVIE